MPSLSTANHRASPPQVDIPRDYNAAHDLIERNLAAGRAGKVAYIDDAGTYTYGELAERVNRCANAFTALGLQPEQRVLLCHLDTIDFPAAFLGAIKAGIVPIAANTLLTTHDYDYMLRDSRARALVVSAPLLPAFAPLLGKHPHLAHVIVSGATEPPARGHQSLQKLMAAAATTFAAAETTCDDACFWLYSSGSTGAPKGTVHQHSSLIETAELYAKPILGIREDDVVFSAAKLFFAYGLGNGLTFPLSVGATTVLMAERPTPAAVFARLTRHQPTIFYGVPTLYAALLASPELPKRGELKMRRCTSAGEALPAEIGRRWTEHFGVEILDGLGSTEMLHIFLSNRPGDVRYGTSGVPVPGYELRIVGDDAAPVARGEVGELQINGPTSAMAYWNNREKTAEHVPGAVDAQRRQVLDRPQRLLRLCGPHRRHAQGGRHLRLADRGRVGAGDASGGAGGRRHRQGGRRAAGEAARLRGAEERARAGAGAGRRAAAARQSAARPVQVSAVDRVHRRAAEDGDG